MSIVFLEDRIRRFVVLMDGVIERFDGDKRHAYVTVRVGDYLIGILCFEKQGCQVDITVGRRLIAECKRSSCYLVEDGEEERRLLRKLVVALNRAGIPTELWRLGFRWEVSE